MVGSAGRLGLLRSRTYRFVAAILLACAGIIVGVGVTNARTDSPGDRLLATPAPAPGDELPGGVSPGESARSDTVSFGYYEIRGDGEAYAVPGETWTFDHAATDPREGWTALDLTQNDQAYWRWMTQERWLAEGGLLPWPAMTGAGMVLCGATHGHADSLGWVNGIGYGNEWCQRLTSPVFTYDGTGLVDLRLKYFNQTEPNYDYTTIVIDAGPSSVTLNPPGFNGNIGIDTLGVITPATYTRSVQNIEFGGGTAPRSFIVTVQFRSDGGLSDEDGTNHWDSYYGACGIDDVSIGPDNLDPPLVHAYDFESDLQGWTPAACPGVGAYFTIAPRGVYDIPDPCQCRLEGNVAGMHDPGGEHPLGQRQYLVSPIVDRPGDLGDPAYLEYNRIFADWEQFTWLPQENGVYYRIGWSYYPYENPDVPGLIRWSPRVGISTFYYSGSAPACASHRSIGTNWGLPATAEQVKLLYELRADCDWEPCWGMTNVSPLVDNLRVRMTHTPNAPALVYEVGGRFQDAFGQGSSPYLACADPGNANVAYNTRPTPAPVRLGDSLCVRGPIPIPSTSWEARLWFRLRRVGPCQGTVSLYNTWKAAMMVKGIDFYSGPTPGFTWGYLDSVESGSLASKFTYCSQFRDGPSSGGNNRPPDPCYNWGGGGEQGEGNEILPDLCFTPGTTIQYFTTANYICAPGVYSLLPDTAGGNFEEFEILPSYRLVSGTPKYPALLYVDASARSRNHEALDQALNTVLLGAAPGAPIPDPPRWDRYDYLDAPSSWCAPLFRASGANNGAALTQLLGYRAILVDTGTHGSGSMEPGDWSGLGYWLSTPLCNGNASRQALLVAGTQASELIDGAYPTFLAGYAGAVATCDNYAAAGCPPGETENDTHDCIRLDPTPGSPLPPAVPIDAFGNGCPSELPFAVLGATGGGTGSRVFRNAATGDPASYAQVALDAGATGSNYRLVLSDYAWRLVTARETAGGPPPDGECPSDESSRVAGLAAEIAATLGWGIAPGNVGELAGLLATPLCEVEEVGGDPAGTIPVTALLGSRPNPFVPRTLIRYALAAPGLAHLAVFDAGGRVVRHLVDEVQSAGPHEVAWDGADDRGHRVAAGVYWSRLSAGGTESNRKLVVLR